MDVVDDANRRTLERYFGGPGIVALDADEEYELRHEDYVMEMPQSGERIRGRATMREFQRHYPNPPSVEIRRIVGDGDVWVIEGVSRYPGDDEPYHAVVVFEMREGRISRDTRYYTRPFPPPEWRAAYVERMA